MSNLPVIQLITSFIAGGLLISFLSLLAEKLSAKTAGIILTFPSTAALGYFFLGWTVSPEATASIVPATFIPLGFCMFFPVTYSYTAEYISKKTGNRALQIVISFAAGVLLWIMPAIILSLYNVTGFVICGAGYFALILLSHFLLHRKTHSKPAPLVYTKAQIAGRAVFTGLMIALVVFLAKTSGALWGGVFTMFPAAVSSYMVLIHKYYGAEALFPAALKIPLGSVSIFVYSITVMYFFPAYGFITGTGLAYIAGIITTLVLIRFQRMK